MLKFLTCFMFSLSMFVIHADAQQDIQFSQYVFNGLILNPAYAGYKEVTNLNLVYRTQWTGLQGALKLFQLQLMACYMVKRWDWGLLLLKIS